ncbi:MAG: hypothetical protein ACREH5_06760 [Candidatus Omnitrophota bacterium]
MKNISVLTLAAFVLSQIFAPLSWARTQEVGMAVESQGAAAPQPQTMTEDAQRYKDLLAIWKDHVKTVTRERDAAYQEIEQLRGQGVRMPKEAAGPAYASGEKKQADETIAQLRSQVQSLQASLQANTHDDKLRLLQRELQETKGDKEIIMRDKEAALREVERLRSAQAERDASSGAEEESQKIIDDLTVQVANLQAEAARAKSLESEIAKLRAEKAVILQSQNQQAAAAQETVRLRNDKAVLEKKYQVLEDNLRLQQARLKDYSKRKDEADRRIGELQSQADAELQNSRQTITQLRSELETLRSDKKALEARAAQSEALLGENQTSRQTIGELRSELGTLRSERQALETRAARAESLEKELSASRNSLTSLSSERNRLNGELAAQTSRSEGSQKLAADLRSQILGFQSQMDSLRAQNQSAAEALQRSRSENASASSRIEAMGAEFQALRQERDNALQTARDLEVRVSDLSVDSERAQALEAELAKQRSNQQTLQQTYEGVKNKYQAQEDRLIELAIRVKDVKQANEAITAENQSVRNAMASLEQASKLQAAEGAKREENWQNQIQALQAQNDKLRGVADELQRTRAEKEATQRSLAELKAAYDSRGAELQKITQDRAFISAELQKLRAEIQKLLTDLETVRGEKSALQSVTQSLQKEGEANRQKIGTLSLKLVELERVNQEMRNTIQGLQKELQANRSDFQALRTNVNAEFEAALASVEKR